MQDSLGGKGLTEANGCNLTNLNLQIKFKNGAGIFTGGCLTVATRHEGKRWMPLHWGLEVKSKV